MYTTSWLALRHPAYAHLGGSVRGASFVVHVGLMVETTVVFLAMVFLFVGYTVRLPLSVVDE